MAYRHVLRWMFDSSFYDFLEVKDYADYESDISFSIRPSGDPGRCSGFHIVGI